MLNTTLWVLLICGQACNAGNMIYAQHYYDPPYYETNTLIYGKHPSKERIIITKVAETAGIFVVCKLFPKYENHILAGTSAVTWGFIINDHQIGVKAKMRF